MSMFERLLVTGSTERPTRRCGEIYGSRKYRAASGGKRRSHSRLPVHRLQS